MRMYFELMYDTGKTEKYISGYYVEFAISKYIPGKTSGPPEKCYSAEGPEIEFKKAYYRVVEKCTHFYFSASYKDRHPVNCECKGSQDMMIRRKERRPELDNLIDDQELIDYAISQERD